MDARVLLVGASDSSGSTGLQADLRTVAALGAHASTAVTAITAQDTARVHGLLTVPPPFVVRQVEVVLDDVGIDCIKTGMLGSAEVIEALVRAFARSARSVPLVVEPWIVGRAGAPQLDAAAVAALKLRLVGRASLVCASVAQAEVLAGVTVGGADHLALAADGLLALGAGAVLVRGAGLPERDGFDLLRTADGDEVRFADEAVEAGSAGGAGCMLASAIATFVARGLRLADAVAEARTFVLAEIRSARGISAGDA